MKKILVLLAGAAVIGGTATACAQINSEASTNAKALISIMFGEAVEGKECKDLIIDGTEAEVKEDTMETAVIRTQSTCNALYGEMKAKELVIKFKSTFVARDQDKEYNVGLIFDVEDKDGNVNTYDGFAFFKDGKYEKAHKIEWTKRG